MSGPVGGRPAALGPLVRLAGAGLVGRRRSMGVVLLAAAPVLVAAVIAVGGGLGDPASLASDVFLTITLGLVIPLAALVFGTAALGTAIEDGTIVYLLVKPVPRRTVVLAAMLVATAATACLAVVVTLLSGLLLVGLAAPGLLAGMTVAALLASLLYVVVFVALSLVTSRALLVGLGYVLLWEGLVTTLLAGTRILSIREYATSTMVAVAGRADSGGAQASVDLPVALALSLAAVVVAFLLGAWRLGRFEVAEAG
ncbi:MAG TPA: ABC transporter permease subunit [Candidatus Nanopelagicales bacterium]|nr:ABC transporter permease subunit [Candidatus Nanopelagicales bacterium]